MAAVAIIAGIAIGVGGIVKIVGDVQTAQAKAREDERKAKQLEELSKPGGYYDQVLEGIHLDLQDVEADRQTAGKILAINALDITRQGAGLQGRLVARAGAGNISSTSGSVVKQQGVVSQTVQENLAKTRLQYEDQLRGLAGRAAQDTANETLTNFKKNAGTEDAAALKSEADWLNSWGVGLSIAGGIAGTATSLATAGANLGLFSGGSSPATSPSSSDTPQTSLSQSSAYDMAPGVDWSSYWKDY